MEEKERYIIGKGENITIVDNDQKVIFNITTKKMQDLLNRKDKRIKELIEENQQLKQSQKQLAISELKRLKENFDYCPYSGDKIYLEEVCEIIDSQIKSLKGEE